MTNNDNLSIQELVNTYKEYLGDQAQEIIVLKTLVKTLQAELNLYKNESLENSTSE